MDKFNSSKKIKVVTLCSGYDSQCMALDEVKKAHPDFDYELVAWSEIDKYAVQMHNLVYPQYADRNLGDMTQIDWRPIKEKYGEIDFLTYSTPCQSYRRLDCNTALRRAAEHVHLFFGLQKKPSESFAQSTCCRRM